MNGWAKKAILGAGLFSMLTACGLGGENLFDPIPGAEKDNWDDLGIICESELTFIGTKTETTPKPAGKTGCWDVGLWEVQMVEVDTAGCTPNPVFRSKYTYEARRDDEDQVDTTIEYISNEAEGFENPDNLMLNLKITTAGDGLCHGAFTHFYPDRTVLDIYATAEEDGSLSGYGMFTYYDELAY